MPGKRPYHAEELMGATMVEPVKKSAPSRSDVNVSDAAVIQKDLAELKAQGAHRNASGRVKRHQGFAPAERSTADLVVTSMDPYFAASKSHKRAKKAAWDWYVSWAEQVGVDVDVWPPKLQDFISMLFASREKHRTCDAGARAVGCIIQIKIKSIQGCAAKEGMVPPAADSLDPRIIYKANYLSTLNHLRRNYGRGKTKVVETTYEEARNGGAFVDPKSLGGWIEAAAFNLGRISGRRSRTVCSIKLEHIVLCANTLRIGGMQVLVPGIRSLVFIDEKYDDPVGDRELQESFNGWEDYMQWRRTSVSWYVYMILLYRGAFTIHHPILHAKPGQELRIRSECLNWFLFPRLTAGGDLALNCVGGKEEWISRMTKSIFERMGSASRGYSAHRAGYATDALISNLLDNGMSKIDGGVERMVCRGGGWSHKRGKLTLRAHYESTAIDRYADPYAIAFGRKPSAAEVAAKRAEWQGVRKLPVPGTLVKGNHLLCPLIVRMKAMSNARIADMLHKLSVIAEKLMRLGREDAALYPIARFVSDGQLFADVLREYKQHEHVNEWHDALDGLDSTWKACLAEEKKSFVAAWREWKGCGGEYVSSLSQHLLDLEKATEDCIDYIAEPDDAYMYAKSTMDTESSVLNVHGEYVFVQHQLCR